MKTRHKYSLLAVAFVAALVYFLAPPPQDAKADSGSPAIYAVSTLGTAKVIGASASNLNYVIDCKDMQNVAIEIFSARNQAGTSAVQLAYSLSVSGTFYDNRFSLIGLATTAYSTNTWTTNISTLGFGYLKLHWFTNAADALDLTTNTFRASQKINAP